MRVLTRTDSAAGTSKIRYRGTSTLHKRPRFLPLDPVNMNMNMLSNRNQPSSAAVASGQVLGFVVVLALLADAGVCLFAPELLARNMEATGFPMDLSPVIGAILAISTLLYAIPRTSVLGAILVTGFLGGAICTHLRLGEFGSQPQVFSALLGIGAWASIYLRANTLRAVLPVTDLSR